MTAAANFAPMLLRIYILLFSEMVVGRCKRPFINSTQSPFGRHTHNLTAVEDYEERGKDYEEWEDYDDLELEIAKL